MYGRGFIFCSLLLFGRMFAAAQANVAMMNVTTANNTNSRTNANLTETTLTRAAVSSGGFGRVGVFPVDGQVYAQPFVRLRGTDSRARN